MKTLFLPRFSLFSVLCLTLFTLPATEVLVEVAGWPVAILFCLAMTMVFEFINLFFERKSELEK